MKLELFAFQRKAQHKLLKLAKIARMNFEATAVPQVISFTAPTGSGKTVMTAAFVESVYCGDEDYAAQSDAIFVWLSDSPELNKQSADKFLSDCDGLTQSQLVMIDDENFNLRILNDGEIYFLNTQKLGKSSNLTKRPEGRLTIWEALQNTIEEKSDRLYFIIDEAHRGMKTGRASAIATTIMQKFIKGSAEDGISPAPLVIGMSATPERFNALVKGTTSTIHQVVVTTEEVRESGLLKERIIVVHPDAEEQSHVSKDMAMLEAAADDWKSKCEHWRQYCLEQDIKAFNPIFVVQVLNGSGDKISDTDLDECLKRISARTGFDFGDGEVVHTFGQTESALTINNVHVDSEEPSRISGNDKIRVVFFKENLSTGWDCPQAETMMSFRRASDATYIAQLLGRMIRTPLQCRIDVDDTLNDVRLFLPHFDRETARSVVEELQRAEGGTLPTDIMSEAVGGRKFDTLTVKTRKPETAPPVDVEENFELSSIDQSDGNKKLRAAFVKKPVARASEIDREAIVKAINDDGLLTYRVRNVRINDYMKSLLKLAQLLTRNAIDRDAVDKIKSEIAGQIHAHIETLKQSGRHDELKDQAKQFRLSAHIFDAFGKSVERVDDDNLFVMTETDIDRQFDRAEARLKNAGIANTYLATYSADDVNDCKLDVIIFAADVDCLDRLERFAKRRFHELNDEYRRKIARCSASIKKDYDNIVADSDDITEHNFTLPETIIVPHDDGGKVYRDHLFADQKTGEARIKLNGWEEGVLREERQREDFVCWIRNASKAHWALCMPYREDNNEVSPMYPDFLIVRRGEDGYVVDILEPHDPTRRDNIGKACGLAEYAKKNLVAGRIQLIREVVVAGRKCFRRLDMSKSEIRERVSRAEGNSELDNIFDDYAM